MTAKCQECARPAYFLVWRRLRTFGFADEGAACRSHLRTVLSRVLDAGPNVRAVVRLAPQPVTEER